MIYQRVANATHSLLHKFDREKLENIKTNQITPTFIYSGQRGGGGTVYLPFLAVMERQGTTVKHMLLCMIAKARDGTGPY
jgi:hypothetical protein